jgi:hypothetical protein
MMATLRYYCETCRERRELPSSTMLCPRCGGGLLDLAKEQTWDYLRERDQSLHDLRQRWIVGFSAIALSVPSSLFLYFRMDHHGLDLLSFWREYRFYGIFFAVVVVGLATFIANKRWPPDPILRMTEEERTALAAFDARPRTD